MQHDISKAGTTKVFKLSSNDPVSVFLLESAEDKSIRPDAFSVAKLEKLMSSTHEAFMERPDSGFDRFCDFHAAVQMLPGRGMDDYVAAIEEHAPRTRYRWYGESDGNATLYVATPGGMCLKFSGAAEKKSPHTGPRAFCHGH